MTTATQTATAPKAVEAQRTKNGGAQVVVSKNTAELMTTVVVTATGYAILELIHHGVIVGYAVPWLMSLGLSSAMISYLTYGLIALAVVGVSYAIYKWFVQTKTA